MTFPPIVWTPDQLLNRVPRTVAGYLGPWLITDCPANQSDSLACGFLATNAQKEFIAIRPLLLTGISIFASSLNGTPAGSLTASVFLEGSDAGVVYDLVFTPVTAADQGVTKQFAAPLPVAKNERVQIAFSTTAGWNSTVADIEMFLEAVKG